ncbi:DUF4124 domain-containing protein [Allohahella marinimesophila]|uniref:DUF4124 domain-containing protein n=2 Tax=Allohahella marinimesophila TaxID=1054972 RepID=A0ABP7PLI9_9GAMM
MGALVAPLVIGSAQAEVYRFTDSEGNVEFTDQPRKGAERVELKETATITLPKPEEVTAIIGERQEAVESGEEGPAYETLRIAYPEDESAFNSGSGDFNVIMDITPDLQSEHFLLVKLDGEALPLTKGPAIQMNTVDRGTHTISVDVVEGDSVIQSAEPVTFTLHRPSVLTPP